MRCRFLILDVFTARPFGGNPLAVLPDAAGLSPATMQAVAAEFGFSETTFVTAAEGQSTMETLPGSRLQLSGSGQWVGDKLRFEGSASAEPQYQDALSNLLNIVGRRNGARSIIQVG